MESHDYLEFVGPDEIKIKGHRIGLEDIVELYWDGLTAEQIAGELPGLPRRKIEAAISYYLTRRADVDAYRARLTALAEQRIREASTQEPPPVVERLRALKAQRQRVGHG
jgi:uncharacterized protein (DUF433 family)